MVTQDNRRVLLVEDEPNIAEAIQFILSRAGWEVIHHGEGRDAPALARELRPALVILDHMLPGLSGLEVLEALRADPLTAPVPVLMLTAKGLPRDREAAERAGATRFMTKPFSNAGIVAEVRSLTGLDPAQPAAVAQDRAADSAG
ncbi:response regulator [Xinfangfangia sp. D13-10-4-6]|uniref:response regulator transcription factor n=1 Tax=Pseudogemmobacter hezensis TaxID=2737662 RepID=UPI0015554F85|nr:response regulator [Pseudogemmobacter hezensis]NPD15818.1 response regulator [Pseudogemmobacter hezensis]